MSRSTLIHVLRRAYRIAQLSKGSGIPSDEVTDMLAARQQSFPRHSRRRLLQGGLLFAGTAIATGLGNSTNRAIAQDSSMAPVLVVGAGLAGLTFAYRLQQAGVPVDVIEARNIVGGRVRTAHNLLGTNLSAEMGGEKLNSDHTYLQGLATELGLRLMDLHDAQAGLTDETFYFEGRKVPISELVHDVAPIAEQIDADLASIENFESYDVFDPSTVELDNLSIAEYLSRIPSSDMIRKIINTAYTTEYGLDTDEQSCLNMLWYIGTEPGEFSVFGTSDERYHIEGGNDLVPKILADSLASSISTGTILEAVRELSDGRYQVTLRSQASTTEKTYDRVVLALPFSALRDVAMVVDLPVSKRLAIAALSNATNTKLITAYSDRTWAKGYNATAAIFSDMGFQNTWESSHSTYAAEQAGLIINYTGGQHGLDIEQAPARDSARDVVSQLNQIFPGLADAHQGRRAALTSWYRDPYSKGSYSCYKVGDWTRFYNAAAGRVRNLFFIGEQCSWEYAGYMEGACETGELTALELFEDLGLSEAAYQQRYRVNANQMARMRRPHQKPFRRALLENQRFQAMAQELRYTGR